MHEISLCQSIRRMIEAQALQHHFEKVNIVRVALGRLSCVEADNLQFAFSTVMKNSIAAAAQLEITLIDGWGLCNACHHQFNILDRVTPCPHCQGFQIKILAGEELQLQDIEVE